MALKRRGEPKPPSALATRILAQREPGRVEVSLERLEADFADASRYEIVSSLKELEKAGSGQFIGGSRGQRSRFVWAREKGPEAGRVSKARARTPKPPAPAATPGRLERKELSKRAAAAPSVSQAAGAATRTLRHSFHLRPGWLLSIELPEDVTASEVARFCSFLEAIPFASNPRR